MEEPEKWNEPNADDLADIRVQRTSPSVGSRDAFIQLKTRLCAEILATLDPSLQLDDKTQVRRYVHERLDALLVEFDLVLNRSEKRQVLEAIVEELAG